jgi:hypothetical protein
VSDQLRLRIDAYALNEDDLRAIVGKRQHVPYSHAIARRTEFVGARQRVFVERERVSKRRHRLLKQMSEGAKHRLPLRFRHGFNI